MEVGQPRLAKLAAAIQAPSSRGARIVASALGVVSALSLAVLAERSIKPLAWEYGGIGGSSAHALCPEQYHVAGARVFRGPTTVAGVTLLCRRPGAAAPQEGETLGARSASAETLMCERGWLSVGIWGSAGTLVDRLGLVCAPEAELGGPMEYSAAAGGDGGDSFHTRCRAGALRGLRGGAGQLLDRVGVICGGAHD